MCNFQLHQRVRIARGHKFSDNLSEEGIIIGLYVDDTASVLFPDGRSERAPLDLLIAQY